MLCVIILYLFFLFIYFQLVDAVTLLGKVYSIGFLLIIYFVY